jgi:cysteine desulfurase
MTDLRRIYLDHNATTPLHPEVKKTLTDMLEIFGNPSSLHGFGRHARKLVEEARESTASLIGAVPEEIVFTGSGSEGNNTILSILSCHAGFCNIQQPAAAIVTTAIEHPCIVESGKCLRDQGIAVGTVGVDSDCKINLEELSAMIQPETGLVSVMMANNETGTIQDIKKIAQIAHEKGALFHTDAVQAVGKIPVDVKDLDVDFLTLSGHKIYGPKGIGAIYVKKGVNFCPLIHGGHQEQGRRAGTENTMGIVGMGKAIEMRMQEMDEETKRMKTLRAMLSDGIARKLSDIHFVGDQEDCVPSTLNVSFEAAEGEAILLYLDLEGLAVSTGSACASGSLDPSHVLLAMGLDAEIAHGSIRLSMGRDTTEEDVEYTIGALERVINKIRSMSSAYHQGRN